MPLSIGDQEVKSGMAKAIYTAMNSILGPQIEKDIEEGLKKMEEELKDAATEVMKTIDKEKIKADAVEKAQKGWKQLSVAIASGVLTHLQRDPANDQEYAEVFSSESEDKEFWQWLSGFTEVFSKWVDPAANPPNDIAALRNALQKFFFDTITKKSLPTSLKGIIK